MRRISSDLSPLLLFLLNISIMTSAWLALSWNIHPLIVGKLRAATQRDLELIQYPHPVKEGESPCNDFLLKRKKPVLNAYFEEIRHFQSALHLQGYYRHAPVKTYKFKHVFPLKIESFSVYLASKTYWPREYFWDFGWKRTEFPTRHACATVVRQKIHI